MPNTRNGKRLLKRKKRNSPIATGLREGEYPTKVEARDADGETITIPTTRMVPRDERPRAPIKEAALSEHLLSLFDGINVRGVEGLAAIILLARMGAHRYPNLLAFTSAWEDLTQTGLFADLYPRDYALGRAASLEQACDVAKVAYEDFVGDISRQAYYYGAEAARLNIHLKMPAVVEASYLSAVLPGKDGFADRKLLFEASKLVESGPQIVNNINNQMNSAHISGLPKWEDTDKLVTKVMFPQRAIAESSEGKLEQVDDQRSRTEDTVPANG